MVLVWVLVLAADEFYVAYPGKESYPVAENNLVVSFGAAGNGDNIFDKAIV